jgi:hypothetical protein
MIEAGVQPDPWQAHLLCSPSKETLLNCSRQSGKSLTVAALALKTVLLEPGALVLLLSPTLRQSGELFRKVVDLYRALGRPVALAGPRENQLKMELANGSRVVSLPGDEGGVRGYSGAALLVIDEATRVADALYLSVRPMLAVSGGRLVALSTPFGKRGWFYDEWTGDRAWQRVQIIADRCPRISAAFLTAEKAALGDRWYRQEYNCEFMDMIGAVFSGADIDRALATPIEAREFPI